MPEFSNYVESLDAASTITGTILIPASHDGDPESFTPAQIVAAGGGGGVSDWGDIGGTLSDQTDLQTALNAKIDAVLTIKTKSGSHTLDSDDLADVNLGKALNFIMDVAAGHDFTIPPNATQAFPVGTQFLVDYTNTGATSFVAGVGVTINSADGLTIAARYKGVVAKKIATNTWLLQGALTT